MESVEYSKNRDLIFSLTIEELLHVDISPFDEEDLDILSIRLKEHKLEDRLYEIYEIMVRSEKTNPAVEYTNIYEELIIYLMDNKEYPKTLEILLSYYDWDQKERNGYRNHFIRRNIAISHIFMGNIDQGNQVIAKLIEESPNDFWTYHDLALEYYFANDMTNCYKYLQLGASMAKKYDDQTWKEIFEEKLKEHF